MINRPALAEWVGAWTFFWPAYAVSLVLDDLLLKIARIVADLMADLGGRFLRYSFSDVFKF